MTSHLSSVMPEAAWGCEMSWAKLALGFYRLMEHVAAGLFFIRRKGCILTWTLRRWPLIPGNLSMCPGVAGLREQALGFALAPAHFRVDLVLRELQLGTQFGIC